MNEVRRGIIASVAQRFNRTIQPEILIDCSVCYERVSDQEIEWDRVTEEPLCAHCFDIMLLSVEARTENARGMR